jgi:hypothetical protein
VCREKTPDDGQRNCAKHVEFYSKNKFEKLVHLVGFIIGVYHVARLTERKIGESIKLILGMQGFVRLYIEGLRVF